MWMTKAAELDLLSAQETLSKIYATGNGAPKDPAKSFIWTMKIASKPAAPAVWLNKAGDILSEGWETVPKNPTQAAEFYERAAAKGDAHAKARLKQMKQGTSHDLVPQE
jgi:TPR repeat protein